MFAFPPGIGIQDVKGCGTSGMVALCPGTNKVVKFALGPEEERTRCRHEKSIYDLLQSSQHPSPTSLLDYYGGDEDGGIVLEYAELGPLRHYLRDHQQPPSTDLLLRWAKQAAEALFHLHRNGIHHGEVDCTNLFLTADLDLKLGDFTRSSVESPVPQDLVYAEIADFGSSLYEMTTGVPPLAEAPVQQRREMLQAGVHPDFKAAQSAVLRDVITTCWDGGFSDMESVLAEVDRVCRSRAWQSGLAKGFGFLLFAHVVNALR